jgi:hypothetical protein
MLYAKEDTTVPETPVKPYSSFVQEKRKAKSYLELL